MAQSCSPRGGTARSCAEPPKVAYDPHGPWLTVGHQCSPDVGTSAGTGGCLEGRMLKTVCRPSIRCCVSWQWKYQNPGRVASKRRMAHERCQSWNESLMSGAC